MKFFGYKYVNFVVLYLAVFLSINFQVVNAETVNMDMFSGQVEIIKSTPIERVAIGNGKIVRVEVKEDRELILIAQSPGSTSLRIWHKSGSEANFNIRVSEFDPETRIRMEKMIRMNVKMIEVRKSAIQDLGINWDTTIAGPSAGVVGDVLSSNLFRSSSNIGAQAVGSLGNANLPLNVEPFSTHFGIASGIGSAISFLASSGDAVTLAEPTLSCVNGGSASFLAGGEVPYPVTGSNGQVTVEFKEYGIKLDINPLADANGNIYANILTEISQIDPAVTVLGAPGLLTRRTETQVNVVSGQTVALTGLLSAENSEDVDRIAGLGNLPIIGALFRSKNFRNQLTELVIFMTPEVIEPKDMGFTSREKRVYEQGSQVRQKVKEKFKVELMD